MKLSKEELLTKISESGIDDEITISLMEDISDSFEEGAPAADLETVKALEDTIEELDRKYKELLEKYKLRFLSGEEAAGKAEEEPEETETDEKEVIDVKEI